MAKGFIIATPFIVRTISGNIIMPALSSCLGGGYSFVRAATGSQQAYNRYLIGGASGAKYAALRARQLLGVQQMPVRQGMGQTGQASGTGLTHNLSALVNYGHRRRQGKAVSTSRAEGLVNEIANVRMGKKQRMRWSPRGAHRVATVRAAVLDGKLSNQYLKAA
jgi:hypothetical protein